MNARGHGRWVTTWASLLVAAVLGCSEETGPQLETGEAWERPVVGATQDLTPLRIDSIRFDAAEAHPGKQLTARVEARGAQGSLDERFTWWVRGDRLPGDSGRIAVPRDLRRGDRIEVEAVVVDAAGRTHAARAEIRVGNRVPRITELGIRVQRGADEQDPGEWIADPIAEDPDGDRVDFRYAWRVEGRGVVSERERLPRGDFRRGDEIRLVVWPSDGVSEGAAFEAAPFKIGNTPPTIVSRPPGLDPSGRFVYVLRAEDRDGDRGLRFSLIEGPTSMSVDPFSGEVVWKATAEDEGEHVVVLEVEDRRGGSSRQRFFLGVEVSPAPPAAPAL